MSPLGAAEPTSFDWGSETLWLVIVKVVAVFAFLMLAAMIMVWWERRLISFMQYRVGPNRYGPFGLLQALLDGLKVAFKEEVIPALADKPVYFIAPVVAMTPAFLTFAIVPFGPVVSIGGHETPLQLTDFGVGLLLALAMSSLSVYGVVLAGWASRSTYPLLGGLRAAAQMISYEIGMGLALASVFVLAGTLSPSEIVNAQHDLWYAIALAPSLVVFFVSSIAETNRIPFDLAEGEGELVGGFHTEYSSMKFVMFYITEYMHMLGASALTVTLFFGGWRAPWPLSLWEGANSGWWPLLWFLAKFALVASVFIWVRATLPRLRYDQLMQLGWKILVPFSLVWLMLVATLQALRAEDASRTTITLAVGIPVVVILGIWWIWDEKRVREQARLEAEEPVEEEPPFPVPPMDLVVPPSPLATQGRVLTAPPPADRADQREEGERDV